MQAGDWLELLVEIADSADEIALRHFRRADLRVDTKPDRTLVTEADKAVEEDARRRALARHPQLGILGEEEGEHEGSSPTRLIIDPIDATSNFIRRVPIFATLLAIEDHGELVAALVSAPALHTRWSAARSGGAFEGKRRMRVSSVSSLEDSQLFHGSIGGYESRDESAGLLKLASATWRQRGLGDFWQHCLVADGTGEIAFDPVVAPWDIAPLLLIVEEAGGRATSLAGERSIYAGSLVTSNGLMHDRVLQILSDVG